MRINSLLVLLMAAGVFGIFETFHIHREHLNVPYVPSKARNGDSLDASEVGFILGDPKPRGLVVP